MPSVFLAPLAAHLSRQGYRTQRFGYSGRGPLEAAAESLARVVGENCGARAAHFIGHSLGGLLILAMLERHPDVACASVLLLGPPARGCLAGRRFGRFALGRWMMGAAARLWEERETRWSRAAPLGVVAGTVPLGLGRLFGALPGENDGVVRVEETAVAGMSARAVVPLSHSMLVVSPQVGALAERFLAAGSFA